MKLFGWFPPLFVVLMLGYAPFSGNYSEAYALRLTARSSGDSLFLSVGQAAAMNSNRCAVREGGKIVFHFQTGFCNRIDNEYINVRKVL